MCGNLGDVGGYLIDHQYLNRPGRKCGKLVLVVEVTWFFNQMQKQKQNNKPSDGQ